MLALAGLWAGGLAAKPSQRGIATTASEPTNTLPTTTVSSPTTTTNAATTTAATITRHATTKTYALTLNVGPLETMYTLTEVKAKHPTSGEVMVGGPMGGSMSMGTGNRHLEVHIRSRTTGKVVMDVVPTIGIHDKTAMSSMAMTVKVPAVAMEGVGQGTADFHYGNNVKLIAGHLYEVVVTVKREAATFTFRA